MPSSGSLKTYSLRPGGSAASKAPVSPPFPPAISRTRNSLVSGKARDTEPSVAAIASTAP